jgi:hypothetical protein
VNGPLCTYIEVNVRCKCISFLENLGSISVCNTATIMKLSPLWLLPSLATACILITTDYTIGYQPGIDPYTEWDIKFVDDGVTTCSGSTHMKGNKPGQFSINCNKGYTLKVTANNADLTQKLWYEYDTPHGEWDFWGTVPACSCPAEQCGCKCRNQLMRFISEC